jgi:hypothetical protein
VRRAAVSMHHEAAISLRRYFDAGWARSSARMPSARQSRLHAEAGGSMTWSPEDASWTWHRRPQVGRGRLHLRLEGHEVSRGSYAFVVDGRRYPVDARGQVTVEALPRERTYRVFVESSPSADPLLSTRFDELDVHIRANRAVVVDVPLDENFELEGMVYREPAPGARRGLGGVRVQLRRAGDDRVRSLRSFQDGFLYDFGIPPGRWMIEPDPDQMARRELVVRPRQVVVDHRPEHGLALYDRLEFLAGSAEDMTDDALAARIWAALASGENESAFAISRILLREAPGSVGALVATRCEIDEVSAGAAVGVMKPILAFPSTEQPGCVDLFVRVADPREDASHRIAPVMGVLATPGAAIRAVPAAALLERR